MGEAFTRHSLRPLHFKRDELIADLGRNAPRDYADMFLTSASLTFRVPHTPPAV
jgi:hypothetical protein